ncbi:transferase, transferring glycosyl group [Dorcoceras hygrometricum]|uniref:Transferase, transferring glycosyl group n=1 Tax=Dorcoceras hygrometricum TaxID=472368 RepID=A0A2Z7AUY1_9LAMI|nr:transferase, transferring glycosyl group [Dorcoceras hygrometricum]
MEEVLERSPTLPRKYQMMAGNDGNSSEKLTVNSNLGFEAKSNNRENISIPPTNQSTLAENTTSRCKTNQLLNYSPTTLAKRRHGNLTKRRRTVYVILSVNIWSPKTSDWISLTTQHILAADPTQRTPKILSAGRLCQRLSGGSGGVLACCVELGSRTASLTMPPRRNREQQQDDDLPPPPPPQMTPFERANMEMLAMITRLLERQTERPEKSHEEDIAERFRKQGPKGVRR